MLTDVLHRAGEEKATHVIDLATLTGAVGRALGPAIAGLFANDAAWQERIQEASNAGGEDVWPLPLFTEYREMMNCDIADINNISSNPQGGAITAALFLQEFVPADISWAHLDIAGVFMHSKPWRYFKSGATGFGVRTLAELVGC